MPNISVDRSYAKSIDDIDSLLGLVNWSEQFDAKYQYLISEIVMLRLAYIFEGCVEEIAFKLACGALYRNQNIPRLIVRCRSLNESFSNMATLNRNGKKVVRYLKWNSSRTIIDNVRHVIDVNDSFCQNIRNHSIIINEIRIVRNHIAHKSNTTTTEFKSEILRIYAGNLKITTGAFLTSTSRHALSNIKRYISSTKIILNDISMG